MPAAQLIVVLSEYRRVGYGVQPGQNLLLSIGNALRVDDEIAEIRSRRQAAGRRRASGSRRTIGHS